MNRRNWLQIAALAPTSLLVPAAHAQVAGTHYNALAVPMAPAGKGIEVIEFFSFACPHCLQMEPLIQNWRGQLPKDVEFRRVPVSFGRPDWAALARMYLTLASMGLADKLTMPIFNAVHAERVNLADDKTRADWLAKQGVDLKKYNDAGRSPALAAAVKRAEQQTEDYKVASVPSLYVDGRYEVQGTSYEGLLANTDLVVAKARAEKKK